MPLRSTPFRSIPLRQIDEIRKLEREAVESTGKLQESLLHLSRKDHAEFNKVTEHLTRLHVLTMVESDQLKAIVETCEMPMKIRGSFARYKEWGETEGLKDLLAMDTKVHAPAHKDPKAKWGEREEMKGKEQVNAVDVLIARRASVGFSALEMKLFSRAADDFYETGSEEVKQEAEEVKFKPHMIMDLKDVVKTYESEGALEPRLAHLAVRLLDTQDKYTVYAMYKYAEDLRGLECYLRFKCDKAESVRRSIVRCERLEQVSGWVGV